MADETASPAASAPLACPSCGAEIALEYCPKCGERRRRDDDLALKTFVLHAFEGLTNVDGKAWASVRELLKPGFLTAEYVRGARQRYLRPMSLFLLANVLYFLLQPWTAARTFNTSLEIHLTRLLHKEVAQRIVDAQLAASGESLDDYRVRFDAASDTLSRTLILVLAPGIALALGAMIRRRRFGMHFAFALHFLAAFQLYAALVFSLAVNALVHGTRFIGLDLSLIQHEWPMTGAIIVMVLGYSSVAIHRAYERGWGASIAGGLAMTAAFAGLVQLYRAMLFFIVAWTI